MILNFGDEILLRGVDWNNPSRVLLYKKSIFVFLLSLGYLFFLKLFLVLNWWARGAHPLNFFFMFSGFSQLSLFFPVSVSLSQFSFPLFPVTLETLSFLSLGSHTQNHSCSGAPNQDHPHTYTSSSFLISSLGTRTAREQEAPASSSSSFRQVSLGSLPFSVAVIYGCDF